MVAGPYASSNFTVSRRAAAFVITWEKLLEHATKGERGNVSMLQMGDEASRLRDMTMQWHRKNEWVMAFP